MTFEEITSRLIAIREKKGKLNEILNKAETSLVDFEDADVFAEELGDSMIQFLSESGFDFSIDDDEVLTSIRRVVKGDAEKTRELCDLIQQDLNNLSGVGLNSYVPDLNEDRLDGIIDAVKNGGSVDKLGLNIQNFLLYCVDQWVKENASFQDRIGLNPVIVRKWDGITGTHDTRHTDYCSRLAGVFEYGSEPSDVYKRHVGCGCTVKYYPDKKSKGRITALEKGEKDINEVLYNTGKYYGKSKQSIRRQRRNTLLKLGNTP